MHNQLLAQGRLRRFYTTRVLIWIGIAIIVLAGLLPATTARADCPDGARTLSESEQQAYLSIQQAIKAAIPPAPRREGF